MSSRYGYDDKDVYGRRDYGRGWDRDRPDWDRDRDWDRHAPRREWDDRRTYDPAPRDMHWDRRDLDRMPPRDDWNRERDSRAMGWNRPVPERDLYRERERDRHDRALDWETGPRGVVRKRDDPYDERDYGRESVVRHPTRGGPEEADWKRRKVDLDEFEASAPAPYPESSGHWEHDQRERHRMEPNEPSQHVIFLGLDPDYTEADLHAYLVSMGAVVDSVTINRDKATGLSRSFGFAQFPDVASASTFVLPNFPFVQLPPPAVQVQYTGPPTSRRVKIDFSRPPNQPSDRMRHEGGKAPLRNDGTRDIGSTATPVVLLRCLEKSTTIDEIEEILRTVEGPNVMGAAGMKRILLVRDRATGNSWGFAFVEMIDTQSAATLLGGIMNPVFHPTGLRITGRLVAASFALPYAFQLLPANAPKDLHCITPSKAVGGVEEGAGWTRYWDENATLEEKTFQPVVPKAKPAVEEKLASEQPKKDSGDMDVDKPQMPQAPAAPTELPSTMGPLSLKLKTAGGNDAKGAVGSGKSAPAANALGFSVDANEDESGASKDSAAAVTAGSEGKAGSKVAPMIASSKVAKNITKWNQVKEELSEQTEVAPSTSAASSTPAQTTKPLAGSLPDLKPGDPGFEYGDPVALTCLLCLRQLKSLTQLQRHNSESDMHKARSFPFRFHTDSSSRARLVFGFQTNLKNPVLCKVATEKVAATRRALLTGQKKVKAKSPSGEDTPKYRDRAQERRRVHNQPEVPVLPSNTSGKSRYAEGPEAPPSPPAAAPAPPVDVGKDENNIGNKLLKKMGWSEGSGLGAEGEGRAEPVKAAVYASGAGLGASKGREVTNFGSSSFADTVKDLTRERYESKPSD